MARMPLSPARARPVKQVRREQHRTTRLPMGGARTVKVDLEQLRRLVTSSLARRPRKTPRDATRRVLDQVSPSDSTNCFRD